MDKGEQSDECAFGILLVGLLVCITTTVTLILVILTS